MIVFEDQLKSIWDFAVVSHHRRIENLRVLLESGASYKELRETSQRQLVDYSGGRNAREIIDEFLRCVFDYVRAKDVLHKELCRYLFIIFDNWGNRERAASSKAITSAMTVDHVFFLDDVEVGALRMGRKLMAQFKRRVVLILSDEGKFIVKIISFSDQDCAINVSISSSSICANKFRGPHSRFLDHVKCINAQSP